MAAPRPCSLFECRGEVPEYCHARGRRHARNITLTLAVAARIAGCRGVNAFAQFAAVLSQKQLEAVGAFCSPSRKCCTAPAITTFHNVLAALPPETLDNAISRQHNSAHAPAAMDGKDLRGASKQTQDGRRMTVAAVEHRTGVVLGQVEVDARSNEIPAVRELSGSLDITGRIVTMDAMHARHETARCLLGRRADHLLSAVKDNRLIPRSPPPHRHGPQGGAAKPLCPPGPKTPTDGFKQPAWRPTGNSGAPPNRRSGRGLTHPRPQRDKKLFLLRRAASLTEKSAMD